jgi:hypothetical protein
MPENITLALRITPIFFAETCQKFAQNSAYNIYLGYLPSPLLQCLVNENYLGTKIVSVATPASVSGLSRQTGAIPKQKLPASDQSV